ncbi:hypothetical protein AL387_gp160 [Salmon gill poxvirus]|uniref:Uncharacterized protein n=1 Tax=Salmon gill poxvirus TaxID=1680908 RepID=A0A0H4YFP9_9POXV|nr:hypothetical protein AL387_gp160 [Salmon gill poxvirus]AKR04284.1 hypothetical protein SGPV160 [Salmon gill poxvirus]
MTPVTNSKSSSIDMLSLFFTICKGMCPIPVRYFYFISGKSQSGKSQSGKSQSGKSQSGKSQSGKKVHVGNLHLGNLHCNKKI